MMSSDPEVGESGATGDPATVPPDPVVVRRRKVARWVAVGQRGGYGLFGVFCVLVALGLRTSFSPVLSTTAIVAFVAGSAMLAPAIVLGYAVKAADREDRDGDWR